MKKLRCEAETKEFQDISFFCCNSVYFILSLKLEARCVFLPGSSVLGYRTSYCLNHSQYVFSRFFTLRSYSFCHIIMIHLLPVFRSKLFLKSLLTIHSTNSNWAPSKTWQILWKYENIKISRRGLLAKWTYLPVGKWSHLEGERR